jgi:hypothetical protein
MPCAAYLLSLLNRQRRLLGSAFFTRRPSSWLVWEPGSSRPAPALLAERAVTNPGFVVSPRQPVGHDALCFELERCPSVVSVGRGRDRDVALDDLSVSREPFFLEFHEGVWIVRALDPVRVDGKQVRTAVLHDTSRLEVGEVSLTFYEPAGFPSRLERLEFEVVNRVGPQWAGLQSPR